MDSTEREREVMRTQELVESYLRGRLPDWFRDAFNERLMDDAELEREFDLREALERGLKSEAAAGSIERWSPSSDNPGSAASTAGLRGTGKPRFAVAASIVLAALSIGLLAQNLSLRGGGFSAEGIAGPDVYEILAVRGATPSSVDVRDREGAVVLTVDPGLPYDAYRTTIIRSSDGGTVRTVDGLQSQLYGLLWIIVPAADLESGLHEVLIEGRNADQPEGRYDEITRVPFEVTE